MASKLQLLLLLLVHFVAFSDGGKAQSMPCCLESLGISACSKLKSHKPSWFRQSIFMCETVADFALVQCCHSCGTDVPSFGRQIFAKGEHSSECYDRHNPDFCRNFVEKRNIWTKEGQMGCSGDGASLAFRICRKTCGYCNETLYQLKLSDPKCPVIG